ncbi:Adenosine 5'-phosphosulfate reductase [Azospirillaceae bacterium]
MQTAHPIPDHDPHAIAARARELAVRWQGLEAAEVLDAAILDVFAGSIAVVSSFGTESAILLALAAEIDPAVPVLFLDSGKLFGETKRYRDTLVSRLGLTNVQTLHPDPAEIAANDRDGMLFNRDHDACCHLRKVLPLERALPGFRAWISGRKRFQAVTRAALPLVEADRAWIKINPLANWNRDDLDAEFTRRDLPRHPLEADGFLSIGCMPCSDRVAPGADPRSGRWAGKAKTECGIHRPAFF